MSFRTKVKYKLVKSLQISNKEADQLISSGQVRVNQHVIFENIPLGLLDTVTFNQQLIYPLTAPLFYKLYKPRGIECTFNKEIKDNLLSFVPSNLQLFHIGRLDKESEGLLLLTNTGQIHDPLLRNKQVPVWKKYYVEIDKPIQIEWIKQLEAGICILGQKTLPCKIELLHPKAFHIWLNQGLNRQIRRMCYQFDLQVTKLLRLEIGEIYLNQMQSGELLPFNGLEIQYLQNLISLK